MVTTQSGRRASNQQETLFLSSNLSLLTSSQGQPKEITEAATSGGLQHPYLANLYLSTSENLNLYNKVIFGPPEIDRYNTISKWADFYQ